ncbi:hypothetical protein LguiA_003834 [Lonicera macranthoides]
MDTTKVTIDHKIYKKKHDKYIDVYLYVKQWEDHRLSLNLIKKKLVDDMD